MGPEQHLDYAKALCCGDGSESKGEYLYCLFEIGMFAYWNLQTELCMMRECQTSCEFKKMKTRS